MFVKIVKGVCAKSFQSTGFFKIFSLQSHIELLVSEMQIKLGVTDFVSEIKRVVKYPDFEKLAHV